MELKYLRMIQGMKKRGKREWSVYVLRCGDGSLYTGIAKDVAARLEQHNKGRGAAYTRTHLPVQLVYQESKFSRSTALVREARVKQLSRPQKERLINVEQASAPISS
jgi:predicted GIY-YIG superfamily endonuclease